MTYIDVSAEAVAALGRQIADLADMVAPDPAPLRLHAGLPPGATASALAGLIGGWARDRRVLADNLRGLAELAGTAGAAYLAAETTNEDAFEDRRAVR